MATANAHRQEMRWQVYFPIAIGFIVILFLSVVINSVESIDLNRLAKLSTIWLTLPLLVFSVLVLLSLIGTSYALIRLIAIAPRYFNRAQKLLARIEMKTERLSDMAIEPILKMQSWRAGLKALWKKAR